MSVYSINKQALSSKLQDIRKDYIFYSLLGQEALIDGLGSIIDKILEFTENSINFSFIGKNRVRLNDIDIESKIVYDMLEEYTSRISIEYSVEDANKLKELLVIELQKRPIRCQINLIEYMNKSTSIEINRDRKVKIKLNKEMLNKTCIIDSSDLVEVIERIGTQSESPLKDMSK